MSFGRLSIMSVVATTALATSWMPAWAQSSPDDRMRAIEQQIQALQQELRSVRKDLSARDVQVRAAQHDAAMARSQSARVAVLPPVAPSAPPVVAQASLPPVLGAPPGATLVPVSTTGFGKIQIGGVTVTLGGFLEAAGIFRTANEAADIASNWNAIPLGNSTGNHVSEARGSARQSRVSLLMQGMATPSTQVQGYIEADFQGAAPTANSVESNSYTPRLRQAFVEMDQKDWGLHVTAGQAWSLVTMTKTGLTPRQEQLPLVIDAQYVPGFSWTRQPQLRVTKEFDDGKFWLGASLESPQTTFSIGPNGTGQPSFETVTTSVAGSSGFATTNNYSLDVAPDLVVKAATDQSFGHFEVFGVLREIRDRVAQVGNGYNKTAIAGGGGAGALIPLVPGKLELQASALVGTGIGRYGSAQLPDATIGPDGAPAPIPEVQALVGLIGHPVNTVDIYGYVGTEQEANKSFTLGGKGYGYGSPLYSNAGCGTELSTATCVGNTSGIVQGTVGYWWRFLHGSFGTLQTGAQYSYTRRTVFEGIGGTPRANEQEVLLSLRYYPFQ